MQTLPIEFIDKMKNKLGKDFEAYFHSLSQSPPVCIRKNPFKPIDIFSDAIQLSFCKTSRILTERPHFHYDPLFHSGCYYVQEAGSMFLEHIFNQLPLPHHPAVLDLCAAPGGKSTHLLSLLNNQGVLVSNEIIPARNKILQQNIYKWGCENVIITQSEANRFKECGELFDLIVVDAPCSGEGLFRKDADAAAHWSEAAVAGCSQRQKDLVDDVISALKPGGFLIYSTCTFEDAENDHVVKYLIEERGMVHFQIHEIPESISSTVFGYQFYPHKTYSEGFYISVLCKTESENVSSNFTENRFRQVTKIEESINEYIEVNKYCFIDFKQERWALIPNVLELLHLLCQVNVKSAGIPLGNITPKYKPHAALALSNYLHYNKSIDLNQNEALLYLSGNSLSNDGNYSGIYLMSFQGKALGWVNAITGRFNNLYPHEWRIALKH